MIIHNEFCFDYKVEPAYKNITIPSLFTNGSEKKLAQANPDNESWLFSMDKKDTMTKKLL